MPEIRARTPHYTHEQALLKLVALEPIEELHAAAVCGWPGEAFEVALHRLMSRGDIERTRGNGCNQHLTRLTTRRRAG